MARANGADGARKTRWAWLLATFFGAGRMKPGPGTYGSLAAVLLWFGAAHLFHPDRLALALATAVAALLITLIGIPASTIVARESGRQDPGFVVIDEVAGQWIALIAMRPDWQHAALALVLFRLFDIWKPWPIRRLEALPAGTGIMLDDVAAGLLALAVGLLFSRWV
jgi:phosphatidylglycerophosphatase A